MILRSKIIEMAVYTSSLFVGFVATRAEAQGVVRVGGTRHVIHGDTHRTDGRFPAVAGITATSCQLNEDHESQGPNLSVDLFIDLTTPNPDGDPGNRVADDIDFLCNGDITGMFWVGAMILQDENGNYFSCNLEDAPAENDDWTVRYWTDDGDGFPDEIVAEFNGDNATFTRTDSGDQNVFGDTLYQTEVVYDTPLAVEAGVRYHVEFYNNYTFNDCFSTIEVAPPGNARMLSIDTLHPDGWNPDEVTVYDGEDGNDPLDAHQCQSFVSAPAVPNPPTIAGTLERVPDPSTGCCQLRFNVENRNCLTVGAVDTFYVAIAKGTGSDDSCIGLEDLSPPPEYSVEFCEPWNNGRAIFKFTGGSIAEQLATFGMIRLRVNGDDPVALDALNIVPAKGVRFWGSQDVLGESLCGTGTFGPLEGESGEWSSGENGLCPFAPIPAMNGVGKLALMCLLILGGAMLVVRSRCHGAPLAPR